MYCRGPFKWMNAEKTQKLAKDMCPPLFPCNPKSHALNPSFFGQRVHCLGKTIQPPRFYLFVFYYHCYSSCFDIN